ncbi:MAG: sulfatase-like hydrolase/transferase [Bacteroidota bacterium]|nr:sulfatase-like hydrolase/transferase [Bacteroidota bacterium]
MDNLKLTVNFIRLFIFWIIVFAFSRMLYILYNLPYINMENIGFAEAMASFVHGLRLDTATACYFIAIPFFLYWLISILKWKWLNLLVKYYVLLIIIVYSLLVTTEMGIYSEWKTKLHYKALMYITNPAEIYNSAETGTFFLLLALLAAQILFYFWIYRRLFYSSIVIRKRNYIFSLFFLLITPPILLLGMRGGVQEIPINQSQSYYSQHNILNLASVNSGFNIFISVFENWGTGGENPFKTMPDDQAIEIVEEVYESPEDTTLQILSTTRPNIILIMLESWSADLIESLGGKPGITPGFNKLEKEGVLFTRVYSSGARSEQGMASIFSGFPAHPISSITVQPDKHRNLPTFTRKLEQQGYATSFYFGGQLIYGNIKSYIIHNGFDRIIEINDFPDDFPQGKLGVHDEFVFRRQLEEVSKDPEPFFSAIFTLSTHSPFDMPMPELKIDWGGHLKMYLNSAWYTDSSLYSYIQQAKKTDWYDSTLFIIVADHSHHAYYNWSYHSKDYHHIPLMFYGNVIKPEYRGAKIDKIGSQVDIVSTLLNQLNISGFEFQWSKNLLNPGSPEFAYVAFEEGIGWIRPDASFFWDKKMDHFYSKNIPDSLGQERVINEGKAFLQLVFQEYMDR